jgi:hypothetical protein
VKERAAAETSDYQPFDIMHVKNKFPAIDEKLAVRLGKMISRRRQIMRYRKRHTNALQDKHLQTRRPIAVAIHDQADESFDVAPSLLASTRYTHDTKATTLKVDVLDRIPSDLSSLYAPTMSTSISSIGSDQSECETPMAVPRRPKGDGSDASKQFICPYCRTAQSIGTDRKWRLVCASLTPCQVLICYSALANMFYPTFSPTYALILTVLSTSMFLITRKNGGNTRRSHIVSNGLAIAKRMDHSRRYPISLFI